MKKKTRKLSPVAKIATTIFGVAVLAFSGIMITNSVKELLSTAQLNRELNTAQEQLDTIKSEQASLNNEKARLQDPAYVQNYARGTQLVSKSGEQVFILPKSDKSE
ncbi:septum formation initiator [Erysipelothrix sp. HDW6C]|nr:septum formation initiator [Erysipelothrix sp. HDW6C]